MYGWQGGSPWRDCEICQRKISEEKHCDLWDLLSSQVITWRASVLWKFFTKMPTGWRVQTFWVYSLSLFSLFLSIVLFKFYTSTSKQFRMGEILARPDALVHASSERLQNFYLRWAHQCPRPSDKTSRVCIGSVSLDLDKPSHKWHRQELVRWERSSVLTYYTFFKPSMWTMPEVWHRKAHTKR